VVCAADGTATCDDTTSTTVELCNGLDDDCRNGVDDDCDQAVDEDLGLGDACDGPDSDLCAEGVVVCAADAIGTVCDDATDDTVETCNDVDDDCDLATDEDFALGTACDGADGDACVEGVVVCAADGTATCDDTTSTTVELCNGLDDDCRNGVDDGYAVGQACTVGVGGCARSGLYQCNGDGSGVLCSVSPGSPTAETCGDGIDQDCNGADVACPTNDGPAGAINISAGGTYSVDLTAARDDDAYSGTGCGSTGGRDVFYTFTLPAAEVVYLDTFGSSFDSVIRLYQGACTARTSPVCDDDAGVCTGTQSQLATQLAAGTYCVVVDQYSSSQTTGSMVLTFTRGGRTGTKISTASGSQTGDTCTGTDVSDGSCRANTAPDVGYFFTVCPSETRTVGASTCTGTTWDSVLYLRKAPLTTDLACNDDATGCGSAGLQSSFSGASASGPGLFWLIVDGYSSNCGAYTVTYTM
ncbi:MAG: hypothetical protein KC464_29245, partial [Myxococcales bacterium]|nr:hypothetical protein [Myxococcales bacterium]